MAFASLFIRTTSRGVAMTVTVDLTQNPSTLEQLQAAGFQQAPVVITPDNSWTGYRPDLIREVAQQVAADNRAAATVSA